MPEISACLGTKQGRHNALQDRKTVTEIKKYLLPVDRKHKGQLVVCCNESKTKFMSLVHL